MSSRRDARRSAGVTGPGTGIIPTDLAAGPCIEVWSDVGAACPPFSARRNWKDARSIWASEHGLLDDFGRVNYRHLPRELRDRAPYYLTPQIKETT